MTSLSFTQNDDGKYVASFQSSGSPIAVQLKRVAKGALTFYSSIGSMPTIPMKGYSKLSAGEDFIVTINVPSGVKITIESDVQVTSGGYEG